MTVTRIQLAEHSTDRVELGADAVAALRRAAPDKALSVRPDFAPGVYLLTASSHVGSIVTESVEVLITPKVPVRNVLAMLTPDYAALALRDEELAYAGTNELVDAVAALYSRSLEAALSMGMRRQYVREGDRLIALRGRIDFPAQTRSPLPSPLACRYDEYSLDTPHNRLLKAAAVRLLRLERVGPVNRAALTRSLQWFGDVSDLCPPTEPILRRGFSRLDAHYRTPTTLAARIVESTSISDRIGPTKASSFLVDMNDVFERFVVERLQRTALPGTEVVAQYQATLDHDGTVQMRPDIVWLQRGRPTYVADTKYKSPDKVEGKNADLYQLVSYATALDVDAGMLIYADGSEETDRVGLHVGRPARTIEIERLDLSVNLDDLYSQVDRLGPAVLSRPA